MPQYPHRPLGLNTPRIVTVDEYYQFVCQYTDESGRLIRYAVSSEDIAQRNKEYHEQRGRTFTYCIEHVIIKGEIPW
jgi:hypothetical protein